MAEVRSITVFKTVAFVHSAIPPVGGQPKHYRHENALWPEIRGRSFLSVLLDTDQLQTNSLLSHRSGHILECLSDDSAPRNFAILLCVKSHHYAISQSAVSTVAGDGYVIVLIQHFQIIHSRLETTFGSPIQRLLFAPIACLGNESEIVGQ